MSKKDITTPSALAQLHISFEYDVTWPDAKKAVRIRTHKD